jgi:predicted HD phosphohydrolase
MTTVDALIELLAELGRHPSPDDDSFTDLDHGLQCAVELIAIRPDDQELALAGLVHDVGHRLGSDEEHGRLGAEIVRPVLGDRVADLVEAHVPAKRFLVTTDPAYGAGLSADSTRTLILQGGGMTSGEAQRFRRLPFYEDAVALRRADEAAKVPGRPVPGLEHWVGALRDANRRVALDS